METIERKTLLYRSGLGFYCVNPAQGCGHGCRYPCYAYMMARGYGRVRAYEEWIAPKLVANAADVLAAQLSRMRKRPETVHLSLTTDPFMVGFPEIGESSLRIVEVLNSYGISCSILSKGILPEALSDRGRFPADNSYGISLISLDEDFRRRWEPGAAPYAARVSALEALHRAGRKTLVHMEPYPTPNLIEQDLGAILETVGFVDSLYFSGWNYSAIARDYPGRREFYAAQAKAAGRFCEARGMEFGSGA